jgi:hypothetical protein
MRADGGPRRADRGQTTLDFAIGVGVFMIAVAFTVTFVPGLFEPFIGGTAEETVAANRVIDVVSNGMLADPADPRVLDAACTVAFFETDNNNDDGSFDFPSGCNYEATDDLPARLGIQGRPAGTGFDVRVRIVGEDADGDGDPDALCADTSSPTGIGPEDGIGPESSLSCDTVFEAQSDDPPESSGSTVVARRGVYVAHGSGVDASLHVEVWS